MRESHPSIDRDVSADAMLWRYMDFPKFVSMLKEGALWFSRADLLGDPLEGSFTQARAIERQQILEKSSRRTHARGPGGCFSAQCASHIRKSPERLHQLLASRQP